MQWRHTTSCDIMNDCTNWMPVQFSNDSPHGYSYLVLSRNLMAVVEVSAGGWGCSSHRGSHNGRRLEPGGWWCRSHWGSHNWSSKNKQTMKFTKIHHVSTLSSLIADKSFPYRVCDASTLLMLSPCWDICLLPAVFSDDINAIWKYSRLKDKI